MNGNSNIYASVHFPKDASKKIRLLIKMYRKENINITIGNAIIKLVQGSKVKTK